MENQEWIFLASLFDFLSYFFLSRYDFLLYFCWMIWLRITFMWVNMTSYHMLRKSIWLHITFLASRYGLVLHVAWVNVHFDYTWHVIASKSIHFAANVSLPAVLSIKCINHYYWGQFTYLVSLRSLNFSLLKFNHNLFLLLYSGRFYLVHTGHCYLRRVMW